MGIVRAAGLISISVLVAVFLAACSGAAPAAAPTATVSSPTATATATPIPTPTPTAVPVPILTQTPISSPTPIPPPTPTPGPLALMVADEADCSQRTDNEIIFGRDGPLLLEQTLVQLASRAELVVRGVPISREQVNIPITRSGGTGTEPPCEWKMMIEFEVKEYLKGGGDGVLRLAITVRISPSIHRPVAEVLRGYDLEAEQEYVLFLASPGLYPTTPGLSGRNYDYRGGLQGRWEVKGGIVVAPPSRGVLESMSLDEMRAIVAEAANSP